MHNKAMFYPTFLLTQLLIVPILTGQGVNKTRVTHIAVIIDPPDATSKNGHLMNYSASAVFERAVSLDNRRRTSITPMPIYRDQTFFRDNSSSVFPSVTTAILPIFLTPSNAQEMFQQFKKQATGKDVAAMLDIASCSPQRCSNLEELRSRLPSKMSILSACCFDSHSEEQLAESRMGPGIVYESIEPHSIVHLMNYLAVAYNWRRFHFVISPHWPTFDILFRDLSDAFEAEQANIPDSSNLSKRLLLTSSYFCTEYLAAGNLCSANQAKELVLRQATAIFMMLDTEEDMPNFIKQVNEISKDDSRLLKGKAFFLVHVTGILSHIADNLMKDAPDGLMIIRHKRLIFDDYKPVSIAGMNGAGPDALLYSELRMMARAVEIYEQIPGEYKSLSELYCGTLFKFDDTTDTIGYAQHCDRDFATTEILNIKKNVASNLTRIELIFTIENRKLVQHSEAHWLGSRTIPPVEDFCKLDSSGCVPPPIDLTHIVTPSSIGFVLLILAICGVIVVMTRRARKRALEEEIIRSLVLIKYDELNFIGQMSASMPKLCLTYSIPLDRRKSRASLTNPTTSQQTERASLKNDVVLVTPLKITTCTITPELMRELIELRDLNDANVTRFLGITTDPGHIFYIQANCSKGPLSAVLAKPSYKLNRLFKISFAIDIAAGMAFVHKSSIQSHGQLTSEHIYVDSKWSCKIGNFPVRVLQTPQKIIRTENSSREQRQSKRSSSFLSFLRNGNEVAQYNTSQEMGESGIRGSEPSYDRRESTDLGSGHFYWTAPELLRVTKAARPIRGTKEGDVYSFGVILSEIISRQTPFASYNLPDKEIFDKIREGSRPSFRPKLPVHDFEIVSELMQVAKRCWDEDPISRPTFKEVLNQVNGISAGKSMNLVDQMAEMLENYAENLERTVAVRTEELEVEKKKSEELLSKMLPKFAVDELKAGGMVRPEMYESVTVYFSDIVGFTALAAESSPMEIVQLLNDLYSYFDQIIDAYDVYKVETIGDAYMVVSGLPCRNGNRHAGEVATMALDIMALLTEFTIPHRPDRMLQLRCGIHSGPVVAGVVGLKMPRYCLFGDTVNYASRMESSGLALRIHVSPECKAVLDEIGGFHLVERGLVSMKGKGTVLTYFLTGKEGFVKPMPDLRLAADISEHEFK